MIRKNEVPAFVVRRRRREQREIIARAELAQAEARMQVLEAKARHAAKLRVLHLMQGAF